MGTDKHRSDSWGGRTRPPLSPEIAANRWASIRTLQNARNRARLIRRVAYRCRYLWGLLGSCKRRRRSNAGDAGPPRLPASGSASSAPLIQPPAFLDVSLSETNAIRSASIGFPGIMPDLPQWRATPTAVAPLKHGAPADFYDDAFLPRPRCSTRDPKHPTSLEQRLRAFFARFLSQLAIHLSLGPLQRTSSKPPERNGAITMFRNTFIRKAIVAALGFGASWAHRVRSWGPGEDIA